MREDRRIPCGFESLGYQPNHEHGCFWPNSGTSFSYHYCCPGALPGDYRLALRFSRCTILPKPRVLWSGEVTLLWRMRHFTPFTNLARVCVGHLDFALIRVFTMSSAVQQNPSHVSCLPGAPNHRSEPIASTTSSA
jgi:hypothetical protein